MVAVLKPPTGDQAAAPMTHSAPATRPPHPRQPLTSTHRTRRRLGSQRIPHLAFAAAGGSAVVRVAGNGLLDVADDLAYATLDRADELVVRSGPLQVLGLAPSTLARVVYSVGSDLAHDLIVG